MGYRREQDCNGVRYHHRLFIWRADFCLLLIFGFNFIFTFAGLIGDEMLNCLWLTVFVFLTRLTVSTTRRSRCPNHPQSTVTSWDSLISPLWGHVWIDGLSSIVMLGWTVMTSRAWIDCLSPWVSPSIHAMSSLSHSSFVFVLDSSLLSSIVVR